ncbi:MAG: PQQ-binding-like beta-propeller repeat protein [Verrucomicrobiota bacterium]|jgi:hypothetical protein
MKLQCSCGAKYAFDATPEMVNHPVKFICPNCGLDSSEFVNELIRREFGTAPQPASAVPPRAAAPGPLRVSIAAPAVTEAAAPAASKFCAKHRELAIEECAVCHKPICPKCMELFGYFCSPLCKGKAEAQHLAVPAFAGRKDLAEAWFWRKTGLISVVIGLLLAAFVGVWTWYAWVGSVPHPYFSARFEDTDRGYSGRAQLVGQDQLVALHGGTLARYDLKNKKTIWSQELVSRQEIDRGIKAADDEQAKANEGFGLHSHRSQEDIERSVRQELQSALTLHVSGQNVWVAHEDKLTHYDWDTGKAVRTVDLPEREGDLVESGDELQMIGLFSVTHISLANGEVRVEQVAAAGAKTIMLAQTDAGGGLPGASGTGEQPLDPKKAEAQAQNLNLQGRIALPALLSNARHEQQLEQALRDDPQHPPKNSKSPPEDAEFFQLVPGPTGFVRFSYHLLEERMVTRSAMKAPPKKSALDGDVNAAKTTEVANEILNGMQRDAGGDTVTEDESRYQVTVHLPGAAGTPDWTGEVSGPPQLFVLKTANVVAAGKSVVVLDKSNKKLWQASLTYPTSGNEAAPGAVAREASPYGEGPCVERDGTLYVFDQAVLTCFDVSSGNVRWRLPSVGVVGLFFDGQGDVYVNTTTGNPDDVKYARQVDISRKTESVVTKIDSKTGKTLWTAKPGGFVSYVSGKFIYVIKSYDPNPTDEDVINDMTASLQKPAYLRISRIRESDGRILWTYPDDRCPVNWSFDGNSILLIFKREVQVLRYLTL